MLFNWLNALVLISEVVCIVYDHAVGYRPIEPGKPYSVG